MPRASFALWLLPIVVICVALYLGFHRGETAKPDPEKSLSQSQKDAIADVRKLGGTVAVYQDDGGLIQIWLTLNGEKVTDDDLDAVVMVDHIRSLSLADSAVTDDGLKKLQGLKELEKLYLYRSRISGKGLEAAARPDIPQDTRSLADRGD